MRRTVIRYRTKPEMADRNAELVAAVFAELKAAQPEGLRYMSLRLEDDTFIHFVESAADDGSSPLPKLAAFAAFAAMGRKGPYDQHLRHYAPVPLWNAGFGVVALGDNAIPTPVTEEQIAWISD